MPVTLSPVSGYVAPIRRTRIIMCLAVGLIAVISVVALTIGPWFWGPDWHVYGDESRQATSAQETAAMKCTPLLGSVGVLLSFPGEIDIHLHGSAGRADRVARCLRRSSGIIDAGTVRSK
jgi:hypothetical protein